MSTAYATVAAMTARIDTGSSTTYSAAEQAAMLAAINAASRMIDGVCRRSFGQSPAGTVRYFTPDSALLVRVPDLVSVSALATDVNADLTWSQAWASTDYQLRPVDAQASGSEVGHPYTEIGVSFATGSQRLVFPVGYERAVKVTGVWGWPSVPDAIAEVALLEGLRMYQQSQAPSGVISNAAGGGVTVTPSLHPSSVLALRPYIRLGRSLR